MNAISVANVAIRQFDNLYSLNDLHKAAGGENRHKPSLWANNNQTLDLISEIEKAGIPAIQKKQGLGTFVCKELVVHYGMWISPAFSLKVIRAFLDTQEEVSASPKTTADERTGLRQAVSALVGKCGIDYGSAYSMVHQRFGVEHIDQIAAPLLPSAIAYVHALTLQGRPAPQGICFNERQIHQFAVLTDYAERMMELLGQIEPALQALRSPLTARACSLADESFIWIGDCRRSLLATTISQYSGNTLPPAGRISARRQ
ncbi:KilA-N domain-containing protein [Eikenella corrodens]|uniref:KilA-N domain-containing protein n=1 Tax=Eikenella corrodens TaxID=539 RepID=UPI00129B2D8B